MEYNLPKEIETEDHGILTVLSDYVNRQEWYIFNQKNRENVKSN